MRPVTTRCTRPPPELAARRVLFAFPRSSAGVVRTCLRSSARRVHRTSIRRIQKPNRRGSAQEVSRALSSLDFEKGGVSQRSFRCASHPAVLSDVRPSRRELLAMHSYWGSLCLKAGSAPTPSDLLRWCGSTWRRIGQIGHCRTSSWRMGLARENRTQQAHSITTQGTLLVFLLLMIQSHPCPLHCPQAI